MESGAGECPQPPQKPIFRELTAEDSDPEITEIESLCVKCHENGTTKLLLTKIPFYKEVIVSSFSCSHCKWENNELRPAAKIQEKGVRFKLKVKDIKDLTRQVVKTEWASVIIPELDFESPPQTQEGTITTIEGVLQRALDGIKLKQEILEAEDPLTSSKLSQFLAELADLKEAKRPFHFILRDCSGNSFLENIFAPKDDPEMEVSYFERSHEENVVLGTVLPEEDIAAEDENEQSADSLKEEVLEFATNCPNCNAPCVTKMKLTSIPHFKDVVIMATSCDACGNNTNEVKSSGGIEPCAVKISLKVMNRRDLMRDLLKSDTCRIFIPELELDVGSAAFTGRYTTVEGLIYNIKEQLTKGNPLVTGDSVRPEVKEKMDLFVQKLDELIDGSRSFTLVLDDPCGNSFLQSINSPDPNLTVEKYERTFEQNEELGLNDMKVENYEES